MLVRPNNDGTYSANWTPASTGWYQIHVSIDGRDMAETHRLQVGESPAGVAPPNDLNHPTKPFKKPSASASTASSQPATPATAVQSQPAKTHRLGGGGASGGGRAVRKFDLRASAGLRIRVHPTLQSEQVGVLPSGGVVSVSDELCNTDGLWVRLSQESLIEQLGDVTATSGVTEGW